MGSMYDLIATVVPGLPKEINPIFAIGGPVSGSGLPVSVTVGANGKTVKLYFCSSSSQCPGQLIKTGAYSVSLHGTGTCQEQKGLQDGSMGLIVCTH